MDAIDANGLPLTNLPWLRGAEAEALPIQADPESGYTLFHDQQREPWRVFDVNTADNELRVLQPGSLSATERYFCPRRLWSGPDALRKNWVGHRAPDQQRVYVLRSRASHSTDAETLRSQFRATEPAERLLPWPAQLHPDAL